MSKLDHSAELADIESIVVWVLNAGIVRCHEMSDRGIELHRLSSADSIRGTSGNHRLKELRWSQWRVCAAGVRVPTWLRVCYTGGPRPYII